MTNLFLYILFQKNNIIMTMIKQIYMGQKFYNKTLTTLSSGKCKFKNKQKTTPFACIFILKKIISTQPIHIIFKGESFFRSLILYLLKKENIKILSITEKTSIPYNGCKYSRKKIIL